jgi:hypothetical protein
VHGDPQALSGLLLRNGDERAIYIVPLHGDDIGLSLSGVEGNCRSAPKVDAGMLVKVLDFLPRPRLIATPDFQLAQVRAGIGLTPTLGCRPCHHGGEGTHEIVRSAGLVGVAVAKRKYVSGLEVSHGEGRPHVLHARQKGSRAAAFWETTPSIPSNW